MSHRRPVASLLPHAITTLLTVFAFFAPTFAAASCVTEIPLDPNSTWQDAGQAVGEASCFIIQLETSGFLAVDLRSDLDASEARLELNTLDALDPLRPTSPQHFYGLVSPGRFLIRVLSVDRRAALDPFRLQVRFAVVENWCKGELDGELEAEPDPLTGGGPCAKGELDGELEAEPDPFTSSGQCAKGELDGELEAEPDPSTGSGIGLDWPGLDWPGLEWPGLEWHAASRLSLCGTGSEDLADDLLCARSWKPACGDNVMRLASELRSTRGGDQDVIRVDLDGPSTLTVRAEGEIDLALRLDDARGQRLDRVTGGANGVRLVRSLAPGTYFVRLAGQRGAEGAYKLRIETERH